MCVCHGVCVLKEILYFVIFSRKEFRDLDSRQLAGLKVKIKSLKKINHSLFVSFPCVTVPGTFSFFFLTLVDDSYRVFHYVLSPLAFNIEILKNVRSLSFPLFFAQYLIK